MRILKVAAFAVSGYASSDGRHCKPFNPLLGETYEADFPEKGIRFFSEKVSISYYLYLMLQIVRISFLLFKHSPLVQSVRFHVQQLLFLSSIRRFSNTI